MKRAAVDEVRSIKNQEREKLLLAIACRPPSVQRRSREVAYDIFRVNSGTVSCSSWWTDNAPNWQPQS
jgi:hypothetical protein